MSDNGPDSHGRRRKPKNWFGKAKDFVFKTLGLYEVDSDDPAPWVMVRPSTLHVGQAEARGQTFHHWCLTRLLI